ncbi:MAG TPA: hypothetical protein VMT54_17870, partial [Candidatus Cybelea sp.]|nr:hypothetical protein [Candidatus Cybelea sp.]
MIGDGRLLGFVLMACLSMTPAENASAERPLSDEQRRLLGTYAAKAEPDEHEECIVILLDAPVIEIEGIWYVARTRLDQPNLDACMHLGIG